MHEHEHGDTCVLTTLFADNTWTHSSRRRFIYSLASLMMQALNHSTEHRTHIAPIITPIERFRAR